MQSTDLSQTLARSCASGSNAGMCGEEYRTLAKCKSRLKFCGFRGFSRCFFVCGSFFCCCGVFIIITVKIQGCCE